MDRCFFSFLDAVATVDVLTESNTDLKLVETVHFARLKSSNLFENKQTRLRLLVLANVTTCLPSEIPRDIAFISSALEIKT